ncbi:MAG: YceI family protein [Bacteroidota bacterium]
MKTIFNLLFILITFPFWSQQQGNISENEQTISWIGRAAVGSYAPEGTLGILNGSISYTSEEITALSMVVDMRTLEQENTQLRDHLRAKDFFYVKKFPVATFILSSPVKIENGTANLTGKMTIRGEAQDEDIKASLIISEEGIRVSFNHTMDRTRYGVNHNSPSIFKKLKENAIADEFVLKGALRFKLKP